MDFGYFTLSDNHYDNNPRDANQLVADIMDEALYAERLGMHSAWIGEHHFNSLGVLSSPELVLANIGARTTRIRLAPAVTVLPLHHPIRVAEQWATLDLVSGGRVDFAAGRGYDRREYAPFNVSFEDNQSIFDESLEVVRALWQADGRISHRGRHFAFEAVRITPQPLQRPIPTSVGSFSRPSIELAARLGCGVIVAPFAAAMTFGGLRQVAELYQESCARFGTARPPDVQLLHAFRRYPGTGSRPACAADPILPGVRHPGPARRSEDGTAELSILRGDGRSPAEGQAGRSHRELRAARVTDADRRDAQEGRGSRLRGGHPLLQRGTQATRASEGGDGAVHGRSRSCV